MLIWLLVLLALWLVYRERKLRQELEQQVERLSTAIDQLTQRVRDLAEPRERPAVPPPPTSVARAASRSIASKPFDAPATPIAPPPPSAPREPVRLIPPVEPRATPVPPPMHAFEMPAAVLSALTPVEPVDEPAVTIPIELPVEPPVEPPAEPPAPPRRFAFPGTSGGEGGGGGGLGGIDWERFVGVKLFSWIAAIALVVAGVYFLKYSMDHGWLAPPIRMAIGILTGVGLLVVCELKAARRYAVTANALDAAGIALLFSTFFAAHVLWHLINAPVTFALLALVTATAVMLSIRRESLFIAALGLLGGFATPALISTGSDNPIGLFGYLLVLNAGLAWVAYRKRWPVLTAASLVFTTLYQWGWVGKFLTSGKLPLAVAIFLIFPLLSFASLILGERRAGESGGSGELREQGPWERLFARTAWASAALPLLFAVYLATVPAYGERFGLLFGFLLVLDVGLAAIAILRGPMVLHLAGAASTLLVWVIWLDNSYVARAWPWVLALLAPFVALFLVAGLVAQRLGRPLEGLSTRATYAAPLLLFAFPMLVAVEPLVASPWLLFGTMFVLLAGCAWYAIAQGEGAIHFIAAFFALAAEAFWSAKHLSPGRLLPALTVYLVFGLFYIGVPILARRLKRTLQPEGAGALIALVSLALLFFLAGGAVASSALWGIALLIAVLNAGIFMEAASARIPLLSTVALVLSWIVLAVWWTTVTVATMLLPALAVITGFALLAIAGNVWARRSVPESAEEFDRNALLGLAGHLFLLLVASRAELSIPPWPMLGVLLVLNLAAGTAALYLRRAALWVAALAGSAIVLLTWLTVATQAPWPMTAVLAAGVSVALGFAWIGLARRMTKTTQDFELAAVGATVLAQIVVVASTFPAGAPTLAFLVGANLLLLSAAFVLATLPRWRVLSVVSVIIAGLGALLWQTDHKVPFDWHSHLWYATPLYLLAVAYPLLLGRRAEKAREPYLAAVVSSVIYFFIARWALVGGGYGQMIGALPVVQGALIALLLARLLRMERPGERTLDRLALVAGAALAFITVAIPLQLDRQWITIGFAFEGAALAWLYTRIPHRGLLLFATGLFTTVFIRLAVNPSVFEYHARSSTRILNWYLYAYLLCAGAMMLGAWLLSRTDDRVFPTLPRLSTLLPAGATILLFLLLNIEIADFYAVGPNITFNFTATLAQDLTYTLGWAVFALAMLAVGIALTNRPARITAIGLLVVTIAKCFLHDLARLGGLYRVGSFVGLAICLSLVAVAIQKFVLSAPKRPPTSPPSPPSSPPPPEAARGAAV